jgi:hypothetical protein
VLPSVSAFLHFRSLTPLSVPTSSFVRLQNNECFIVLSTERAGPMSIQLSRTVR